MEKLQKLLQLTLPLASPQEDEKPTLEQRSGILKKGK